MKPLAVLAFLLTILQASRAFKRSTYRSITRTVLENSNFEVNFTGFINFTDDAIDQIVNVAGRVDRTIAGHRTLNNDWHFYDERFEDATERLVLLKQAVEDALTNSEPDTQEARRQFGRALNTLMDFYSHTNWVELGNTEINTDLGDVIYEDPDPDTPTCNNVTGELDYDALTTFLTSGYRSKRKTPEFKCHIDALSKEGSNDDGFDEAKALALNATYDYLDKVVANLGGNEPALRKFLDRDTAVIFVIDTTESMREALEGIKEAAQTIIDKFNGTQTGRYILISFGDSNEEDGVSAVRSKTETADPNEFLANIEALAADGNGQGDCREDGWDAMREALSEAGDQSNIYFWSDASQKDGIPIWTRYFTFCLRPWLLSHTCVRFVMTGRCVAWGGPSYRVYRKIAELTGGSFQIANPEDVGSITFDD